MKFKQFIVSALFFAQFFMQSVTEAFAQPLPPEKDTSPVSASDTSWYSQPWVWFIILAMLTIGIVYYSRSNKRRSLRKGTQNGLR